MDGVEANWGGRGSFFDPYNNNPGADFLTAADDLSLAETAGTSSLQLPRIVTCGDEMESLCRAEMSRGRHTISGFPPMCLPIVRLLGGNHCCVDCGEEDQYASISYGTILCNECASRHMTMSGEESKIVSIKEGSWNLRHVLVMLEGSNTHMLEYIKAKPRWRPSFGKANDAASEEVLAFKQIYLSKAATSYRKLLDKKANEVYLEQVERMRIEDETKEHKLEAMQFHGRPNDPVRQILESHNADDFRGEMLNGDKHLRGSTNSDGSGNGNRPSMLQKKGRQSRLIASEAPTVDQIRAKINKRRGMNAQIQMMEADRGSVDMGDFTRRLSSLSFGQALVGEVNEAHIQNVREEQPYDAGHLLTQGHFGPTYLDRDDLSFCSRNSSRRPRVGQYRRMRSNTSQQEQFKPQPGLQYQESI